MAPTYGAVQQFDELGNPINTSFNTQTNTYAPIKTTTASAFGGSDNGIAQMFGAGSNYAFDPAKATARTGMSLSDYDAMTNEDKMKFQQADMEAFNAGQFDTGQLLDTASALGGLGLGVASYFGNSELRDKQIAGLDEQIASSKEKRGNTRAFIDNTTSAFA